jgi:hypothetical protein
MEKEDDGRPHAERRELEAHNRMGEMIYGTDSVSFLLLFAGLLVGPRSFGKERTAQTDAEVKEKMKATNLKNRPHLTS